MVPLGFAGLGPATAAGVAAIVRFKSTTFSFQLQMPRISFRMLGVFQMPVCFRLRVFFFPHLHQPTTFS
jgi:hypothetical protein